MFNAYVSRSSNVKPNASIMGETLDTEIAEKRILAICLNDIDAYKQLIQLGLKERMFLDDRNRSIFQSIVTYRSNNNDYSVHIPVLDAYKAIGASYFSKVLDSDYVLSLTKQYYNEFKSYYIGRQKLKIIQETEPTEEGLNKAAIQLANLIDDSIKKQYDLSKIIDTTLSELDKRYKDKRLNKYTVGWHDYDELGYHQRGNLYVIGGESGHGKSTLIANLINKWLRKGLKVLLFENEMTISEVFEKIGCIMTRYPWDKCLINKGVRLTAEEYANYRLAILSIGDFKLYVYEQRQNIAQMNLLIDIHKPDVFILDTINALIPVNENRKDVALGEIARTFKDVARSKNALGVIVAQLKDLIGRPTEKNLIKESREIRDAADTMDFIYREEEKNGLNCPGELEHVMEVFRVKGRFTGTGKSYLYYDKQSGFIGELDMNAKINTINYLNSKRK